MARKIYLVDTENEGGKRYADILQNGLGNNMLYLFFTEKTAKIDLYCFREALRYPNQVVVEACNTGKNGLDFQLCSMLGYLAATGENTDEYFILSNDSGYDPCVEFWKQKGKNVARLSFSSSECKSKQTSECKPKPNAGQKETTSVPDARVFQQNLSKLKKSKREAYLSETIKTMKSSKASKLRADKITSLLTQKNLRGYDANIMAHIYTLNIYQQELIKCAFGDSKTNEFFARTSKNERRKLAK